MSVGPAVADATRSGRRGLIVYAAFLALTISCFYNRDYFYYWDEWDALEAMSARPIRKLLFVPHNEHLMPVHRLFFYAQTSTFGEHYFLHVLLNCGLHALNGWLLLGLLRAQGIHRVVAGAAATAYLLTYGQWDNIGIAFQSQIFLCTLFALAALRLALRREGRGAPGGVLAAGGCAVLSAWSFGTGLVVAPALSAFALLDRLSSRRGAGGSAAGSFPRREGTSAGAPLWPIGWHLAIFAGLCIAYTACGGAKPTGEASAIGRILHAATPGDAAARLGRLAAATLDGAWYAPLWLHLAALHKHPLPEGGRLAVSAGFIVAGLLLARGGARRGFFLRMLIFQTAVFFLIAVARMDLASDACFADRYQTFGLIAPTAALAVIAQALLDGASRSGARRAAARAGAVALTAGMVLSIAGNVRLAHARRPENAARRGLVIRDDYYRLKREMTSGGRTFPNVHLTRHGHPGLSAERLARAMAFLDPSVRPFLPGAFIPVEWLEQRANTRPWGHIAGDRGPEQSIRFTKPGRVVCVALWFATGGRSNVADCRVALLDDAGRTLHEAVVPGRTILNNLWVGASFPSVAVAPGREYRLRIRSTAEDAARGCTVWMNGDPRSWPDGETRAEDGAPGDLCFSIAVSRLVDQSGD